MRARMPDFDFSAATERRLGRQARLYRRRLGQRQQGQAWADPGYIGMIGIRMIGKPA